MITVFCRTCGNTYKEQHTAAYELLYAAASLLGLKAGEVKKTEKGKPYFENTEGVFFSIAHTDGLAVAAIGDENCGIDVETEREISERVRNKYLEGKNGREALELWTRKESFGKYEGSGFFAENNGEKVKFTSFSMENYVITLCTREDTEVCEKLIRA